MGIQDHTGVGSAQISTSGRTDMFTCNTDTSNNALDQQ
jgi:hypothetical protein